MKKSFLYIIAIAATLFSCDPYKDLHDEANKNIADQRDNDAIPTALTISDEDTVFATVENAQKGIPSILSDMYAANHYTDGKIIEVTYSVGTLVEEPEFNEPYTLSQDNYKKFGLELCFGENCYYGFESKSIALDTVNILLDSVYAAEEDGFLVMSVYDVFVDYTDGLIEDAVELERVHTAYIKEEGKFEVYEGSPELYMLYAEDYDEMGSPGKYNNFSSSDAPENYLPQFAAKYAPYAQEGHTIQFLFKYYAGRDLGTITKSMVYTKSTAWDQVAPLYGQQNMDKFKYKSEENSWKVSLAVVVTLTGADYAVTGDEQYSNFGYYDNVAGEYPEGTPVDNIIDAKINHILNENYPQHKVADQEVTVYYNYYDNGTNEVSRNYIYDAGSETFVRQ
ncbi:hypothetical protein KMW28_11455 [Flammeovirga yaeyamensis]|uniref:DUF5017 domain-containing protein n=1 Tax=Flammeovirga yaeyamensis TaxID=367791 RepID=A0AAX1MY87_9BACT|nr:hypothetical protein [Flammeovirga yaeyamensis]MBB3696225.1 hypothetical protein [Flammeovirga yaeyamensis]NMF34906.1 hypothetical protein [Flammeovirga yaeyamensis]QWG00268.1 hypothetical protein KMW28_11455 [Flammeovirga yaeyamensis]